MDIDLATSRWASTSDGKPVYLKDIWPTQQEVQTTILEVGPKSEMFHKEYGEVFQGDEHWNSLPVPTGDLYAWDDASTYVKNPPYFEGMEVEPARSEAAHRRPRSGRSGRQHHDRPHLARPARSRPTARPAAT